MDTDTHPIESLLNHTSSIYLHREPSTLYTESAFAPPPLTAHANETGNVRPENMDQTMDDDAKEPGPFQQRNDPATETEDAVAESMDESTDGDSRPQLRNKSQRQTQGGPRTTDATKKRNANKKNKRRARQVTEAAGETME